MIDAQSNIEQIRVAMNNETEVAQSEPAPTSNIQNISVITRPSTVDDSFSSRSSSPSKEPVYKRLMNHGLSVYVTLILLLISFTVFGIYEITT